jgi:uncharacterized protein YegP (UPF0339 family)
MTPRSFFDHSAGSMSAQPVGANDEGGQFAPVDRVEAYHDIIPIGAASGGCYFDVFCVERVSLTSVFFAGGDWRWAFHGADGLVLAQSDGYASEMACRTAVAALRAGAGSAIVSGMCHCHT